PPAERIDRARERAAGGLMTAERRADAAHQQRTADGAGRDRSRGAEERASSALLRRRLHRRAARIALLIARLLTPLLVTLLLTPWVGTASPSLRYLRHRATRRIAAENAAAHRVEKPARLLLLLRRPELALAFLDVRVCGFE